MKFRHVVLLMMLISKTYVLASKQGSRKCHQCRSDENPDCLDIKDSKYLKICDKNSTTQEIDINPQACVKKSTYACRKTYQTLYFLDSNTRTIVLRECTEYVLKEETPVCYSINSPGYFYLTVCECEEEGCNRCPKARPTTWSIVLLLFLRVLFPP